MSTSTPPRLEPQDPMELAPHEAGHHTPTPPDRLEALTLTGFEETSRQLAARARVLAFAQDQGQAARKGGVA